MWQLPVVFNLLMLLLWQWKCYITVVTCALLIWLICMHEHEGCSMYALTYGPATTAPMHTYQPNHPCTCYKHSMINSNKLAMVAICNNCNVGMRNLPDRAEGIATYHIAKSWVHMLQLLCNTFITLVTNVLSNCIPAFPLIWSSDT